MATSFPSGFSGGVRAAPFHFLLVLLLVVLAAGSFGPAAASVRSIQVLSDESPLIPLDDFGFARFGVLELNVSGIAYSGARPDLDLSQLGFLLSTRDAWLHVLRQLEDLDITCALQSDHVQTVFTFDRLPPSAHSFAVFFREGVVGQFTLVFANCLSQLPVSMNVSSAMYNDDPRTGGRDYLSAGATAVPLVYLLFFLAYATLAGLWALVLCKRRLMISWFHYFMLAVVVLEALTLLCMAEHMSCIKHTGSAHAWVLLFYLFSFLRGITLFVLVALVDRRGRPFLRPFLVILMVVILLQTFAGIAQVAVDEGGPYARDWLTWKQVIFLVDAVCCCALLFPLIWSLCSTTKLRAAAITDEKVAANLMRLTLFRRYYLVFLFYIYFTKVAAYALPCSISYLYVWVNVVVGELATLAFFLFTGYKFKPEAHNPYSVVDNDEEEAAAGALKLGN